MAKRFFVDAHESGFRFAQEALAKP